MSKQRSVISKNSDKAPALLLGLHYAGLQVARCLGKRGIRVYGIDKLGDPVGAFSRYLRRLFAPAEWDNLRDFLIDFSKITGDKPVLFPLSDYYILFLLKYADDLNEYYCFPYKNLKVAGQLVSKVKAAKLFEQVSIPHPKTYFIRRGENSLSRSTNIEMPCILKPEYQHCWEEGSKANEFLGRGKRVLLINSYDALENAIKVLSPLGNLVAQEFIDGPSYNSYYFVGYHDNTGRILTSFVSKKVRTLPDRLGSETFLVSVDKSELIYLGKEIMNRLEYKGPIGIDFKYNHRDALHYVVEINPRIGLNDCYLARWGMDIAWSYYLDSIGIMPAVCDSYPIGVRWFDLLRDIDWMRDYRRRYRVSWYEWSKTLLLKRYDVEALASLRDPIPILRELNMRFRGFLKRFL